MTEIPSDMLLRAQQGDEAATRAIVAELQRPVTGTIYRFLGPADRRDVEDLAQEVFLKTLRRSVLGKRASEIQAPSTKASGYWIRRLHRLVRCGELSARYLFFFFWFGEF